MNVVLVLVVAAIAGAVIYLAMRKRAPQESADSQGGYSGVPAQKRALFDIGMQPGADGVPVMYTLATCRHCVHLKDFLTAHNIDHHLVFVDDFKGEARTAMMTTLRTHNPRGSFPTLVLPGGKVIVGYRENQVREAFGLPAHD